MSQPSKKALDLLSELDAEFGKKKKDVKTAIVTQRNDTGNALAALIAASNLTARSWAQVPGWRATRRITFTISQKCKCCLGEVKFVGNEFTEFENQRLRAKVKAAELVLYDELGFELPRTIEHHTHEVDQCVSCLTLSRKVEDLVDAVQEITGRSLAFTPMLPFGNFRKEKANGTSTD